MSLYSKKQLDTRFTLLSALGMIFIVDGHLNGSCFDIGGLFPYYSFHVPLFCFISGYFYKKEYEETPFSYVKRKFIHFLFPYMLWNFIYGIGTQILLNAGFSIGGSLTFHNLFIEPFISGHQFVYNLASWFVPALFLVEVINMLLRRCFKKLMKNEFINVLFYLAVGIGGITLSFSGKYDGGWLTLIRTMFLLPTYQFGVLYKSQLEKREPGNNLLYFGLIIVAQLYLHIRGGRLIYEVAFCRNFTGFILPYITIITGIAFWLRVASILAPSFKESKILAFFGSHTYVIMLHHLTILMAVKTLFAFFAKYTSLFSDFNFEQYKSDIWYYYYPKNLLQFRMVYLILAIAVPLLIQYTYGKLIHRGPDKAKVLKEK